MYNVYPFYTFSIPMSSNYYPMKYCKVRHDITYHQHFSSFNINRRTKYRSRFRYSAYNSSILLTLDLRYIDVVVVLVSKRQHDVYISWVRSKTYCKKMVGIDMYICFKCPIWFFKLRIKGFYFYIYTRIMSHMYLYS